MKNNKIRIIVVAVFAIVIVLATLYFLTDVFKSNKEMFFKTLSKNTESLNAFKVEEPKESKNAYDLKGNFEIKMDEQTNLDFDVEIKNDKAESRSSADLELSFMAQPLFGLQYLRNNDIHAIHIPNITDQYIAIENNNLKEFFAKFGMDTENIPDQIKTVDTMAILQKYQDKIDLAKEKYIKVLSDNLAQDQFSKAKGFQLNVDGKDYETTQYSLKMTEQEVYDVYQKVYETLYQDQETLQLIVDLVNETNMNQLTIESLQQKLEDSKEEIDNMASQENLADATVTFNVYYAENAVLKTEVLHSEGDSLALTFIKSENKNDMIIETTQEETVTMKISQIKSESEIKYVFLIEDYEVEMNYKPQQDNDAIIDIVVKSESEEIASGTLNYTEQDSVEIEELNENNAIILNTRTQEELSEIFSSIIMKVYTVFGLGGENVVIE